MPARKSKSKKNTPPPVAKDDSQKAELLEEVNHTIIGSSVKESIDNDKDIKKSKPIPTSPEPKMSSSTSKPDTSETTANSSTSAPVPTSNLEPPTGAASPQRQAKPIPAHLPFKPSLPSSLPLPKSGTPSSTPSGSHIEPSADSMHTTPMKRSAPSDFQINSPPNKGVKFQDGLSPGEGKEGETIIPGVDKHNGEKGGKNKHGVEKKKASNAAERAIWTVIMIAGFIVLLCMGAPALILLVMLCQTLVYKEVTALFSLYTAGSSSRPVTGDGNAGGEKWNKTLNWYFFVVTNYFLYGESIIYYFKHIVFIDAYLLPFARNHRFISFMLYIFGFMAFVANLQRQYLRQQFALFCWVHMTLLVIVVSSHFIVNNILEGLIWFFVPASLVICNDVMAYICGKAFGKTPLIKLSPKKTMEGFVGAFFCTLLFALVWGTIFMRFNYMICPAQDLGVNVFSDVKCDPNPVFLWRDFHFPGAVQSISNAVVGHDLPTIPYTPYHFHLLVMASFASLAAPFGGFFASGFKRAFNIKDFGDSIPGHGGMTDRMDCQFMMGLFSYVYYSSLIRVHHVTVGSVLQTIVNSLTVQEQIEVLVDLRRYLDGQGVKVGQFLKA